MENETKSRTQKKKEDKALQSLGEQLTGLSIVQLNNINMPDDVREAVMATKKRTSHGARKREMKHIAVLLREIDVEPIRQAFENIRRGDEKKAYAFKQTEKLRDDLKQGNMDLIEEILDTCPDAERRHLTQLVRNAIKENTSQKGVKASRQLFRYLKLITNYEL